MKSEKEENFEMSYDLGKGKGYEYYSVYGQIKPGKDFQMMEFRLPRGKDVNFIRVDFGTSPKRFQITNIKIEGLFKEYTLTVHNITNKIRFNKYINVFKVDKGILNVETKGINAYIETKTNLSGMVASTSLKDDRMRMWLCVGYFGLLGLVMLLFPVRDKFLSIFVQTFLIALFYLIINFMILYNKYLYCGALFILASTFIILHIDKTEKKFIKEKFSK